VTKAMVMAAGAGTRLRPLTFSVPKPMVPVANRPVLEYTLNNLRRHGITDLILNLHNHPDQIRNHFKDGSRWGVNIHYSPETKLMGTAGGVKKAAPFLKGGTFLVMSGDGLTDIDLTALLAAHKRSGAEASMALKAMDYRFDYGVTLTDRKGRITRFLEKPRWSDVFSNTVNTGIYVFESSILSKIPANQLYDFGHELWPKLLAARSRIFAFPIEAYWCDIGSLSEYRRAQKDVLDGKLNLSLPGRMIRPGIWVDEGAVIDRSAKLEGPCLIGKNTRIGKGTRIGPHTVIGDRTRVGDHARLIESIVWNNATIGAGATLDTCLVGHNVRIPSGLQSHEGTFTS
jgi:mannose-1-phosphate guanylyltransferase/phosphomannomutase